MDFAILAAALPVHKIPQTCTLVAVAIWVDEKVTLQLQDIQDGNCSREQDAAMEIPTEFLPADIEQGEELTVTITRRRKS